MPTDLTLLATTLSEIAPDIVRFAGRGEIAIELLEHPRHGVRVEARNTGPGIVDVERARTDGYSAYHGRRPEQDEHNR